MKKTLLALATALASFNCAFGQANALFTAPPSTSNFGTSMYRAPNGVSNYAYMRGAALVLQSEITGTLTSGVNITTFGFLLQQGTTPLAVAGNFTLFLQNTTDVTYQKGLNWTTIPTGMTQVYASAMTIPVSATSTSIIITLSTPFNYTGGGLYVAYDWFSNAPLNAVGAGEAIFISNTALANGCSSANAAVAGPAPTAMTASGYRPCFLFGYPNPNTNDMEIIGIEAPGKVASSFNTPHNILGIVKNSSTATLNNINVSLNVSGANTFANTQNIATLAPGAMTTVTFAPFNPQVNGMNTVSVSVGSDQNNLNNSSTYPQMVTCYDWAQNPPTGTYTYNALGFATGSGIVSTTYSNVITTTLTGLRAAISNDANAVGKSVYGVLMNAAGAVVATTNTLVIQTPMLSTFQGVTFATPQNLLANTQYYIGFAQIANATAFYPAGTLYSPYLNNNLYWFSAITGGPFIPAGTTYGYFGIEGTFASNIHPAIASPTGVCIGSSFSLTASGANTYTWSTSSGTLSTNTVVAQSPQSNTTYSLTGANASGCTASTFSTVVINSLPSIAISSSTNAICVGSAVDFTASGAASYSWTPGVVNPTSTTTMTDSPVATTIYTVSGTNINGCVNSNTIELTVNTLTLSISGPTAVCIGSRASFTAIGAANYIWNGSFPFSVLNVTPTAAADYTVVGTDVNGCPDTKIISVAVNQKPNVTASATKTLICVGEGATLNAGGATTYSWTGGTLTSSLASVSFTPSFASTQTYVVKGTDVNGCVNQGTVALKTDACTGIRLKTNVEKNISVFPNPNNGLFTISINNASENTRIEIYNTLGALVKKQIVDSEETTIDLKNESNGIYLVYVLDKNKTVSVSKIVKQ